MNSSIMYSSNCSVPIAARASRYRSKGSVKFDRAYMRYADTVRTQDDPAAFQDFVHDVASKRYKKDSIVRWMKSCICTHYLRLAN